MIDSRREPTAARTRFSNGGCKPSVASRVGGVLLLGILGTGSSVPEAFARDLSSSAWATVTLRLAIPSPAQQETQPTTEIDPQDVSQVVAWIDDQPVVRRDEIERLVQATADPAKLSAAQQRAMFEQARSQLVGRRLILLRLQREKHLPTETDIDVVVTDLQQRLEVQGITWANHLEELGVDEATFRMSVRWKIGWRAELERRLTDDNLRRFYDDRRREFDGTELEVSQIVIPINESASEDEWTQAVEQLGAIRKQIEAGEIDFAAAAKTHSQGATAAEGGSLGAITRHGAMPEAFSAAAFALETGEVSEPIRTGIGVHLIRCDAVRPGSIPFEQSLPQVRLAAMQFLFDFLVAEEKKEHQVRVAD